MKEKTNSDYEENLKQYASEAKEDDVENIAENLDDMKKGPIAGIWEEVVALWEMVQDPNSEWGAKALAIGALVYLVSPIDAVPDIIPILGLVDDAGVIGVAVAALGAALEKYKKNKAEQDGTGQPM